MKRNFFEKPGISTKFVCITFAQYCTIYFFKKRLLLLKKHFKTVMLMSRKKITLSFYRNSVNIFEIRPND